MRNTMSKDIYDAIVDQYNTEAANDVYFDLSVEYCQSMADELNFLLGYEIGAGDIYDVYADLIADEREELCFLG